MSSILAVSIPVGLFLSIVFIESSAILLGCTAFTVLPVLFFVIALLHQTNIRLSALTSVLLRVVLRGLVVRVLGLGMDISPLDSFFLNVS